VAPKLEKLDNARGSKAILRAGVDVNWNNKDGQKEAKKNYTNITFPE
jgi:hypothetical protein